MSEWKPAYEDAVEGRWVTVKVYESENDEDRDDGPVVRVTVAPLEKDDPKSVTGADADDNSITLDPDLIEDLKEELIEIGFSPESAAWIVAKVPVWAARPQQTRDGCVP